MTNFLLAPFLLPIHLLSSPLTRLSSSGIQSFLSFFGNHLSPLLIALSFSSFYLSSCIVDLAASETVLSAVGIMTISWVARLFIFVPNEVRFLSAIATVSMDTLHLDTRSHPVLNVLLWAAPSPVCHSLINSEFTPLPVCTVQKPPQITMKVGNISTTLHHK